MKQVAQLEGTTFMNKIKIVLLKQEDRKKDDYLVVSRCKFDVKDSRR